MNRTILLIACLIGFASPCMAQRLCDQATPFHHATATGPVEIVAPDPVKRIYFCGFMLAERSTTLDFQVWMGQGTNCATNPVALTPQLSLPSSVMFSNRIEWAGPALPFGNALCIQTFGTGDLTGAIYWAQF